MKERRRYFDSYHSVHEKSFGFLSNFSLEWRHNDRDGVSNHQNRDCLLNCLFGRKSKKTSKLRVTGLCVGNSPVIGDFPTQRASNAENVSIWWRHHKTPWTSTYNSFFISHVFCEILAVVTRIFDNADRCMQCIFYGDGIMKVLNDTKPQVNVLHGKIVPDVHVIRLSSLSFHSY